MDNIYNDLQLFIPELLLAVAALAILAIGAFMPPKNAYILASKAAIITVIAAITALVSLWGTDAVLFNKMVDVNTYTLTTKIILGVFTLCILLSAVQPIRPPFHWLRFEFPVLILLSLLGMMIMVSSQSLLSLYLGLELSSLSLYIMASMDRNNTLSSEAGLKYFMLGALSSGILLFGSSLIYGFTGHLDYSQISNALIDFDIHRQMIVLLGIILVITGILFKVSAVPFHMWTPDVYQGSPTLVTAFFASVAKAAALFLLIKLAMFAFLPLRLELHQIMWFVAAASMILASFAALRQNDIKRLLAYSSIGHAGYILIGLAAGNLEGIQAMLIYTAIYGISSIGMFGILLLLKKREQMVTKVGDFAGLAQSSPHIALFVGIFMFSMAGIPPLAGFFGKFYVFMAAIREELYCLAIIGVITSVISAFYYLRVIKLMYFDKPETPLDLAERITLPRIVVYASGLVTLLFFTYPTPLIQVALKAAKSLLL